jgi:uncharacterized protein YukE
MRIGADPEALLSLSTRFARVAEDVEGLLAEVDRDLEQLSWWGPDAQRFRSHWATVGRSGMAATATALREAHSSLEAQAHDQQRASAASTLVLDPLAERAGVVTITAHASGEIAAGALTRTYRVETRPDRTLQVTRTDDIAGGIGAAMGGRYELSFGSKSAGFGKAAGVVGLVHIGAGTTWTIAEDDLDRFLVNEATEAVLATPGGAIVETNPIPELIAPVAPFLSAVGLREVAASLTYTKPSPDSMSVHIEQSVSGSISLPLMNRLGVSASELLWIQREMSTGHVTAGIACSLGASAFGWSGDGGVAASLTVDGEGKPLWIDLSAESADDAELTIRRARVLIEDRSVGEVLELVQDAVQGRGGALVELVASGAVDITRYAIGEVERYGIETPFAGASITTTPYLRSP